MSHRRFSEDERIARAWASFARHDAAQVAPPGLDARVRRSVAARRGVAVPEVVTRRPLIEARVVVALAACLVAAVAAGWWSIGGGGASIDPPLPEPPAAERTLAAVAVPLPAALDEPARRPVALTPVRRPAPARASRPVPATASADGPLQVIRVRIAASALDALGVAVAGPIAPGLVDVDLVVSADGWPMEVRRIRPVTAGGPVQ